MIFTEQGHALRIDNQVEMNISKEFDTAPAAEIIEVSTNDDMVKIAFVGGELRILCKDGNFRSPEAYQFVMPDGSGFINRGEE